MGLTWEIGTHTFLTAWVIFPHKIPILWYTSSYGNTQVSPSISYGTGKCNKTHRMGKTWEIFTHTIPIVLVLFSHQILIRWYTSLHGKCICFLISFPKLVKRQLNPAWEAWEIGAQENPTKPIVCGEPGKLVPILFPQYGCFFLIRFTFYGILHNM